ncbi:MAG: DsrE family protein [Candidatus Ranarchaeia archaeon]
MSIKETENRQQKFFLYVQTNGISNPDKQIASINLARTAIALGHRAMIYYFEKGATVVMEKALDGIKVGKFPPLDKLLQAAIKDGVEINVCERFARNLNIEGKIIPEAKIVGTATLNQLALDADVVLTF